ncbi:MAG: hypothetical protein CMP65_03825 [Flavobacteriales bacterium]|nr:hypothetical protein [Flavobacteriales bacterium]
MRLITFLFLICSYCLKSQNVAYVDSRYILDNIPEFNIAQDELNNLSLKWQEEIDLLKSELDQKYRNYQAEKYLLPENKKEERENLIIQKEQEIKTLTKKRFGPEGDLYQKQQELIQPIQDLIYGAVKEFSDEAKYDLIFDKSSDLIMLFANPELDKSQQILEKLGY